MTAEQLEAWMDAHPEWTATALAAELGVTIRALRYWRAGERPIPAWLPIVLDGPPLARRRPAAARPRGRPRA